MCATAHLRRVPVDLPGLPVAKATPIVASRTQTLIDRSESLAHGGRAFVENVKEMAASGMLDRQKMMDWVRIVSLFNKATGKDTSHGLLDMVHHLLSHMPLTDEERLQQQEEGEQHRSSGRARANATKPPELDELSCYMISRGGNGAETMFCSEAMKQLFISTDELKMTVQETGLTSVSVWATITTPEGLATLNRAASTVFLQKDTEQMEVELECMTRTGLLVACSGTVSFRVLENRESMLILSLTVKQDAPPRSLGSSSSSSRSTHAASEKAAAAAAAAGAGAEMSSNSRRTTYASERLAALASKREYEEQQKQQQVQQQQESRRRRPRPSDEAPSSSFSSTSSLCSSASSSSTATSTSSSSLPSSRPPPQRTAVSSKRRKVSSPVTWSQEGPPLPEALFQRLLTHSKNISTMAGAWSHDEKEKVFAWTPTLEQQQQLQQQQQQQQQHQQKKEDDEDDIWAWADSIWEEAEGTRPPLDLGTGLGVGVVEGRMEGGVEGGVVGSVEDPSLWLMLDQQGL